MSLSSINQENKDNNDKEPEQIILIGLMVTGEIIAGAKYKFGPFNFSYKLIIIIKFRIIEVCQIQCNRISVKHAYQGQFCSISFIIDKGRE